MRVDTVTTLAGILAGIKINRISDKEVKAGLLKDFLALRKVAKKVEDDKQEIVNKFREDWKNEVEAVDKLRAEGKPVKGHHDYLLAEKDVIESINALGFIDSDLYGEKDIELVKVKSEPLYDPDIWAEDITLGQIPGTIDFLIANGVAE